MCSLVLGQEIYYIYIFYMKTLPTPNCVYPNLVLELLTSWPTVRSFQFIMLTDQCDRPWCHLSLPDEYPCARVHFRHFEGILHHFILVKLATSSIRVRHCLRFMRSLRWCKCERQKKQINFFSPPFFQKQQNFFFRFLPFTLAPT